MAQHFFRHDFPRAAKDYQNGDVMPFEWHVDFGTALALGIEPVGHICWALEVRLLCI